MPVCTSLVLSHSCLSIHASHTANVRMLSISLNVVLSVFHDLFTHLNPPRTSIFNRGGSHVFPWPQNGYGVYAQHAQCVNAYFSAVLQSYLHKKLCWSQIWSHQTAQVTWIWIWKGGKVIRSIFVCFVEVKLSKNFSTSALVFLKG